jgi:hypothetical protein
MPAPQSVTLLTAMHIGKPATPVVKVGDHVDVGTLVAEQSGFISSPVYASVSGTVKKIADEYKIDSVMTFGGEPLLCVDTVCAIHKAATEMGIRKRQLITNGFFSKDTERIKEVAKLLSQSGVNEMLLSVDAFHQETIPLEVVKNFAIKIKRCGVPIKLQPAWLVSPVHDNLYNRKTREILDSFRDIEIYENKGNVIFPEGNAKKYLSEYFISEIPENPYVEDPFDVRCVSFSPNGDVLGGNVYKNEIMDILYSYNPT